MKNVPPQMPKQDKKHYIVVLCMAIGAIVLCSITGRLSIFSLFAICISVTAMAIAWKEFELKKEWIIATAFVSVAIGICIFTIFNGLRMSAQYRAQRVLEDIYDDYNDDEYHGFDDLEDFLDEGDIDYFD